MADTVTTQTIIDGPNRAVIHCTNVSDGTGESAVAKVDVSALAVIANGQACTKARISRLRGLATGMTVNLLFDASTDVLALTLPDGEYVDYDFESIGGLPNNAGSGVTGDILATTVGHSSGDRYWFIIEVIKT